MSGALKIRKIILKGSNMTIYDDYSSTYMLVLQEEQKPVWLGLSG